MLRLNLPNPKFSKSYSTLSQSENSVSPASSSLGFMSRPACFYPTRFYKQLKYSVMGLIGILLSSTSLAQTPHTQFESPQYINAQDFLGQENMQSAYHTVDSQAFTDGFVNTYKIESADGIAEIIGTQATLNYISEVKATHMLRQRSTLGAIGKSAYNRTTNLVTTPYRTAKSIYDRAANINNVQEAVLFIPNGVFDVAGNLLNGVGEAAVTGVRITKGAAGTKCGSFGQCLSEAGEDIWSGTNSVLGKHNAARRLHKSLGTNPESRNKALQRQIDRLSYAEAYTGTAYKFGVANAGIDVLSPYQSGIGWFNNGEFLAGYEDAHRARNRDKAALLSWGVTQDEIDRLYNNEAFTKAQRAELVAALSHIPAPEYRAGLVRDNLSIDRPYIVNTRLKTYQYLAHASQKGAVKTFISGAPATIFVTPRDTLVLPVVSDYLQWSPDISAPVTYLSQNRNAAGAEIHVIGKVSPDFRRQTESLGVKIIDVG